MEFFKVLESAAVKGYYFINFTHPYHQRFINTTSSYSIFPSRLLGLSYPDYLKFARAKYNAEFHGKNGSLLTLIFKEKKDAEALAKELNLRYIKLIAQIPAEEVPIKETIMEEF